MRQVVGNSRALLMKPGDALSRLRELARAADIQ
jgi:hypothetical protein